MSKIFNWLFGACFRTLGRFLAIFIVGVLLVFIGSKIGFDLPDWLGIAKVSAATVDGWTLGLDGLNEVFMYDCTGSENCSKNISVDSYHVFNTDRYYVTNNDGASVYTNGVVIHVSESNTYIPGYLYSARIYMCSNIGARQSTMFSTTFANRNKGISYDIYNSAVQTYSMSTIPYGGNTEMTFSKCFAHGVIFSPSTNTTGIEIRFKSPNSSQSDIYFDILGLKVENLGVYDKSLVNQIDEIIDNSGYATAESVEEVNTAVNQVKQEVKELNNSIDETNNNIMNSTSPDVSGMTDLAGYLPPGPLDSVLNLPLSILNSLNSKLSSSCSPLSLTLPFVNLPLNIPCLSTIFSQINGLNTLFESIGVILGALILYKYLVYLYNWVDDVTSLRHTKARLFGAKSDADNWGGVE